MSNTAISFRPDDQDTENLEIAMGGGSSKTDAIRRGLALAAEEQRVMNGYDELLKHLESLGANPTAEDHEWAARVSP